MTSTVQERNAVIEKARITREDHGVLSVWLMLDYGDSSGQGFGGYALYAAKRFDCAGQFIWRVLDIVGVDSWDKVERKTIRVRCGHGSIEAIGHIIKDDWFVPKTEMPK